MGGGGEVTPPSHEFLQQAYYVQILYDEETVYSVLPHNIDVKRYRMCMLLNGDAHNVSIRNIKVSKHERHITYSVTKYTYVL